MVCGCTTVTPAVIENKTGAFWPVRIETESFNSLVFISSKNLVPRLSNAGSDPTLVMWEYWGNFANWVEVCCEMLNFQSLKGVNWLKISRNCRNTKISLFLIKCPFIHPGTSPGLHMAGWGNLWQPGRRHRGLELAISACSHEWVQHRAGLSGSMVSFAGLFLCFFVFPCNKWM